jgi:hypothetical protein
VNPDGVAVGFGANGVAGAEGVTNTLALTAYTHDPIPGTWTLVVDFADPVVGNEISQPFTGNIHLDGVSVHASGLPDSVKTRLAAGVPVVVPVSITNNGAATGQFFIDARLSAVSNLALNLLFPPELAPPDGCGTAGFPLPLGLACGLEPEWLVPTQTSSVQTAATATLPIEYDYSPAFGDPDLYAPPTGPETAGGSYTPAGGSVEQGFWFAAPDEIGPYAAAAPVGLVNVTMNATTKAFDPAVSTPQGDLWLAAIEGLPVLSTFDPITIKPGQTKVITVTIKPAGTAGTVVTGNLYVNSFVGALPPSLFSLGDELAAIPYTYTIDK